MMVNICWNISILYFEICILNLGTTDTTRDTGNEYMGSASFSVEFVLLNLVSIFKPFLLCCKR